MSAPFSVRLTEAGLHAQANKLAAGEPFFRRVIESYGLPPLFHRPPGFPTLVWIILEQQVSLASARAAYNRLEAWLPEFTPQAFLQLDDAELKTIGFSRQKTAYTRGLAEALHSGAMDLAQLETLTDDAARSALIRLKGVGPWTADVYLLMALGRPDIWPAGDLALVTAVRHGLCLIQNPTRSEMEFLAEPWRPHRTVAAHLFWHYYLSEIRPHKGAS